MDKPYRIDFVTKIVHFHGAPGMSFKEWNYALLELIADDDIPKQAAVLIDMSFNSRSLSTVEFQRAGPLVKLVRLRFGARVALVSSSVGTSTLTNIVALETCSDSCRAFLMEKDAVEWLTGKNET